MYSTLGLKRLTYLHWSLVLLSPLRTDFGFVNQITTTYLNLLHMVRPCLHYGSLIGILFKFNTVEQCNVSTINDEGSKYCNVVN